MGAIETLYTAPPDGSVVVCLDEMGPESAKNFLGQRLVHAKHPSGPDEPDPPAERARQEIDYGRCGKDYIFGTFRPARR